MSRFLRLFGLRVHIVVVFIVSANILSHRTVRSSDGKLPEPDWLIIVLELLSLAPGLDLLVRHEEVVLSEGPWPGLHAFLLRPALLGDLALSAVGGAISPVATAVHDVARSLLVFVVMFILSLLRQQLLDVAFTPRTQRVLFAHQPLRDLFELLCILGLFGGGRLVVTLCSREHLLGVPAPMLQLLSIAELLALAVVFLSAVHRP
jgi:hypothetical protein